ncbi:MAG: hypothetical protein KF805_12260 [Phycisphaeraceae bacterium]|nr:hypothetical protein [Phycisphaeraceae bacterium]
MPVSAQRLLGRLRSKRVNLSGELELNLRVLSSMELDQIADLFPRPAPPLGQNPTAGSLAPPIPREDDVGYQRRLRRWYIDLRAAEVCVAIDYEHSVSNEAAAITFANCPEADRQAWLRSAVDSIKSLLPEPELRMLSDSMHELSTVPMVKEAIKILIIEREGELPPDVDNVIQIPQNYDRSEMGLLMTAAERYGQDPIPWIDQLEPAEKSAILAHEMIRRHEEAERMGMLMTAARIAAV